MKVIKIHIGDKKLALHIDENTFKNIRLMSVMQVIDFKIYLRTAIKIAVEGITGKKF